jgi:DNA-binding transcriptional ArsR family regulator
MNGLTLHSDAFRWSSGLGKTAGLLWDILRHSDTTLDVSDLSGLTGKHRDTIRRNLARLREHGLIEEFDDGTSRALDVDLEPVAVDLGSAGAGQRQRDRHERERGAFRELIPPIVIRPATIHVVLSANERSLLRLSRPDLEPPVI